MDDKTTWHDLLLDNLQRSLAGRVGAEVVRIETHISTVLLAGDYAYKIKKPVDLGFLDFSTLERRRFCCQEELRLNRRLAPSIYLEVVSITGAPEHPALAGQGEIIDYAVKMRRFSQSGLLSNQVAKLDAGLIDHLAIVLAGFHGEIERAGEVRIGADPAEGDKMPCVSFAGFGQGVRGFQRGDDPFQPGQLHNCIQRLPVLGIHDLCSSCPDKVRMKRSDPRIIKPGRNRIRLLNLPVFILNQQGITASTACVSM